MRYTNILRCAVGFTLAVPLTFAAKPLSLQKESFQQIRQAFTFVLPDLKQSNTSAVDTLVFQHQHIDDHHVAHIHLQQKYAGFPVVGGYAIFHSKQPLKRLLTANAEVTMTGTVYADLASTLGDPAVNFISQGRFALQQFKSHFSPTDVQEESIKPIVYIDRHQHAFWAYQISLLIRAPHQIPKRPTAIMEAGTFKTLLEWDALPTIRSTAYGYGFGGNNNIGMYQFGHEKPVLNIQRDSLLAKCFMENKNVKVIDMNHQYGGITTAMHFDCKKDKLLPENTYWTGYSGDGYNQENGAYSPANDALYAGQVIHDMYETWYGIPVLKTPNGASMKLAMRVHYGLDFENAFWDGRQMTFGDGEKIMHPLVSIGIGAHEISHGFTEQHANLQYVGQSGGINEAFSDMAAQAAEQYALGKNNWTIGAEVMKIGSGRRALRFMSNPSRDGRSIENATQYREGLDVHYASGVYNRLFYILATQPEWDVKRAFQVMIKANMDYWTPYSNFVEAGCGLLKASDDLGFSVETVKLALEKVMISVRTCVL